MTNLVISESGRALLNVRSAIIAALNDPATPADQRLGLQAAFNLVDTVTRQTEMPPPEKTVRVRIAVAVDMDGDWNCAGWSRCEDAQAMSIATDTLSDGEARYFLLADLPVPGIREIRPQVQIVQKPLTE